MTQVTAAKIKELRDRTSLGMLDCKKALEQTDGDIEAAIEHLRKSGAVKAAKRSGKVAAEGMISMVLGEARTSGALVEVNCETDFVGRDAGFGEFVTEVTENVHTAQLKTEDFTEGEWAERIVSLTQKVGEKILVRRIVLLEGAGVYGYVHNNNRMGALVVLSAQDAQLGKDLAMQVIAMSPLAIDESGVPKALLEKEMEIFVEQARESGKPAEIIEKMVVGYKNKFMKDATLIKQPFIKNEEKTVEQVLSEKGIRIERFERLVLGEGIEKKEEDFAKEVMAQVQKATK